MIVKVQIAIGGNNGRRILVYDKDKTVQWEGPLDPDTDVLMAGRPKQFFEAHVNELRQIVIERTAPWQEW